MSDYRKGLPERPARMLRLPLNDKGYPVPWFVDWVDGKPDFRLMDRDKWFAAVYKRLCWLCGQKMGRYMTFVAGPMCGINRTSSEPPSHRECAEYAARACPFLTLPKAVRREAGLPEEYSSIGGNAIKRNPGVAMLWTTHDYRTYRVENGWLIEMGEPTSVDWFAEGRAATRAEVEESVRTGMPFLEEMANKQDEEEGGSDAKLALLDYVERFEQYLPRNLLPVT